MRIPFTQFRQLKVRTHSGVYLGKTKDCVIDCTDHSVVQYLVRAHRLATREYLIHRSQVLSVSDTEMIVEDSLISSSQVPEAKTSNRPEPVSMTEAE